MYAGTDVAKEASDMIMLDKDLERIAFGVTVGRTTYGDCHSTLHCFYFFVPMLINAP